MAASSVAFTTNGPPDADGPAHKSIPNGFVIYGVEYHGCNGGLTALATCIEKDRVERGCFSDAWWLIRCPSLPDRSVRLTQGLKSLQRLVARYGLLDAGGCVNSRNGCYSVDLVDKVKASIKSTGACTVPKELRSWTGIPQRTEDSGICWYAALCFCMFFNKQMRACIIRHLPPDLATFASECLASPDASERLRKGLWERYAFGDLYGQPPELDGQNGVTQMTILCSQIGIPVLRMFVDSDAEVHEVDDPVIDQRGKQHILKSMAEKNEDLILVFRFRQGNHGND